MKEFIAHQRVYDGQIQSVMQHLFDVSKIAKVLTNKIGLPEVGELLGLLHDFGKYSDVFQSYIGSAIGAIDPDEEGFVEAGTLKGKIDHSTAGAQYLFEKMSLIGGAGQGELCAQILSLSLVSHHSGLIDCLSTDGDCTYKKRLEKNDGLTHLREAQGLADSEVIQRIDELLTPSLVQDLFTKVRSMVDFQYAAKNKGAFRKPDAFSLGFLTRFLFSCLIDADRLDSAEFEDPERKNTRLRQADYFDWSVAIERLEQKLKAFPNTNKVSEIRREISDTCLRRASEPTGCYTLTVPTGGGKTLASLRYALHHANKNNMDRIIYIIPYTSIIEQNAQAIRDVLELEEDEFPWVLEHHSNIEPENQTWHSKLVTENWDAPVVFTTMVQFLETLFSGGTRGVRRLHQLANSVLIFDEIQTLPINCTHLFCNAINFLTEHAKTTAVMCTATQPVLDRLHSVDKGHLKFALNHELVDAEGLATALRRVDVVNECKPGGWSEDEIHQRVIEQYQKTQSCLVIVNTKAWARCIYKECEGFIEPDALFHLSTNQYAAHRKQLLEQIRDRLKQNRPVLCISTQLIEAGVDVDFASVIRFLAGLDSIAQAAGRCNRNGRLKSDNGELICGQVSVINPSDESIDILVDIKEGKRNSERIFSEFESSDLLAPATLTRYFDYFFFERSRDMDYPLPELSSNLLELLGNNYNNVGFFNHKRGKKIPLLQQSFMAAGKAFKAIDAPTQSVIVAHGEGKELVAQLCSLAKEFDAKTYYQVLKRAQAYGVNVFPNVWEKLKKAEAVQETQLGEGIYYLKSEFYNEAFGLGSEPCGQFDDLICC